MMQDQADWAWGGAVTGWQSLRVGRDNGGHLVQPPSQSEVLVRRAQHVAHGLFWNPPRLQGCPPHEAAPSAC